jgi:hypothetical protein
VTTATVSGTFYDTGLEAILHSVNWHLHFGHDKNKIAGLISSRDVAWFHLGGSVNFQNNVQKIPCQSTQCGNVMLVLVSEELRVRCDYRA